MNRFEDIQTEWQKYGKENPSLVEELERNIIPLLLNSDEDFLRQGMDLLSSIGSFAFCFLLEEDCTEEAIFRSYPKLSQWSVQALKEVLRSFNLKVGGKKKELVERINDSHVIRLHIVRCLIEEINKEESDWFALYESGTFDRLLLQSMNDSAWSEVSKAPQQRLLLEVRKMVEIPEKNLSVGKYQVTQALWESVMGSNPSEFKGSRRPVEKVTWFDCVEFCNKLSEQEGLPKVYAITKGNVRRNRKANGYRLPSEFEWMYCAKAHQDFEYSGSDNPNEVAWTKEKSSSQPHGVGQKKPNGFGLYDMSGNVWEWCFDWYGDKNPTERSTGPSKGSYRVRRGGSWFNDASYAQLSRRHWSTPSHQFRDQGFRLFKTIQ